MDTPEASPKFDIQITPSDKFRTVSGGFDVYVTVTNPSKANINTAYFEICLPRAVVDIVYATLERTYPRRPENPTPGNDEEKNAAGPVTAATTSLSTPPPTGDGKNVQQPMAVTQNSPAKVCWPPGYRNVDSTIPPGGQASFQLSVPKTREFVTSDELFFRRDSYPIQFLYEYTKDKGGPRLVAKEHKTFEFRPGLSSPLSGVIAGTFLIAVFIGIRREGAKVGELVLKNDIRKLGPALLEFLWTTLMTWISGMISGLILVVVLNQTDTQELPVTVSINDFWGGAFLGLIAYKLSDWIDQKFFSDATKKNTDTPPTGTPPTGTPLPGTPPTGTPPTGTPPTGTPPTSTRSTGRTTP